MINKESVVIAAGIIPSLKVLCALFEACSLFIGTSTGALHLAATVKVPSVVLCGPEDHIQWRPVGEDHELIIKDVSCRPCNEKSCSMGKLSCLNLIKPADVYHAIDCQLEKRAVKNRAEQLCGDNNEHTGTGFHS